MWVVEGLIEMRMVEGLIGTGGSMRVVIYHPTSCEVQLCPAIEETK